MDWPILPDEADEIPDELALRVGKAALCDHWLTKRFQRALEKGGKHDQDALGLGSALDQAERAHYRTLTMALEALDE